MRTKYTQVLKACWRCGKVFPAFRSDAETCGPACRQAQWRSRKKTVEQLHPNLPWGIPLPLGVEKGSNRADNFVRDTLTRIEQTKNVMRTTEEEKQKERPAQKARGEVITKKKAQKGKGKVNRPSKAKPKHRSRFPQRAALVKKKKVSR